MTFLEWILIGMGGLVVFIIVWVVIVVFFPVLSVSHQPLQPFAMGVTDTNEALEFRHDVSFFVNEARLSGWLYLPVQTTGDLPCIIMSTGFGGTKDAILERYAIKFIQAGMAVLTYDYRHFGESDGQPRQLFGVSYQLDDLRAAVAFARSREEIDPDKIVLWSNSAAGAYGIVIAAEDHRIAAVISQCGAIDHKADTKLYMQREGLLFFMRLLVHAQRDKGRSRFGLSPHRFPIVGKPGSTAMFVAPEAYEGYSRLTANSKTFRNEVCARLFFMKHGPDPIKAAEKVACPVLFLACEKDNLVAPDSYKRAADVLGDQSRVRTYPVRHFEIYEGEVFDQTMNEMLLFLKLQLNPAGN